MANTAPVVDQDPVAAAKPSRAASAAVSKKFVRVDGKFFRVDDRKFYPKGVTYGPFAPDADGCTFPPPDRVVEDFRLIAALNANCLRVYHVPPRWFLDLAHDHGLKILVDYYWPKHTCFLDDAAGLAEIRRVTREVAEAVKGHPAVFAITLANEIPPDIARWYGASRICGVLDELAAIVKAVDPDRLVTFANYPPTEFLQPAGVDFLSYNVYLHDRQPFANYLDRLQSIAAEKPLVLTEFGMDSLREGEEAKAAFLTGHIETAYRAGVAGTFIFAFTDDWHTGGHQIENWFFGLTDVHRQPRAAFHAVAGAFAAAPYFPLTAAPRVSVVVASYNGGRTLPACLDSLQKLNYPDYEVILVDDGSTDNTRQIVTRYPEVRAIHQENHGLSVARNEGIAAARGQIVAFTDSDCRVDIDWLYYLVGDLLRTDAAAIGGHNFPPLEDDPVAGCVAVAPGGPAHVMLDDRHAEHIPGCNMAFWKWALDEIDGFDPIFRAAGDDVDICWRILQRDWKIAFSHAGFVWHYRRNTVEAYLNQQTGYGVAEALLQHKHPEYFNSLGGTRWKGRIYNASKVWGVFGRFTIYHGIFGGGLFQTLYTPAPSGLVGAVTSLEWHLVMTVGTFLLTAIWFGLWPIPALAMLTSVGVAVYAAQRVVIPAGQRRWWSRFLVAVLYLLQPIVRGWPRYSRGLASVHAPPEARTRVRALARSYGWVGPRASALYWTEQGIERFTFLHQLIELLDRDRWPVRVDSGWDEFDLEIYGDRFSKVSLQTVAENHGAEKRMIRGKLSAQLTLFARLSLLLLVAALALVLGLSRHAVWTLPLFASIPLFLGYLHLRTKRTLRLGLALLDMTALELGLSKLDQPKKFEKPD